MKSLFVSISKGNEWVAYWRNPDTNKLMSFPVMNPKEAIELMASLLKAHKTMVQVGVVSTVEWPKLREKLQKIEQNKDLKKIAATASTPWIAYWQDPNTSKWMIHPIDTPKEACQIVKALFKKYNELINVGTVAKDKWKEHKARLVALEKIKGEKQ
jgi:CO dehydrogenase/acetyl-CoA synthase epsilon subunit